LIRLHLLRLLNRKRSLVFGRAYSVATLKNSRAEPQKNFKRWVKPEEVTYPDAISK